MKNKIEKKYLIRVDSNGSIIEGKFSIKEQMKDFKKLNVNSAITFLKDGRFNNNIKEIEKKISKLISLQDVRNEKYLINFCENNLKYFAKCYKDYHNGK